MNAGLIRFSMPCSDMFWTPMDYAPALLYLQLHTWCLSRFQMFPNEILQQYFYLREKAQGSSIDFPVYSYSLRAAAKSISSLEPRQIN